MTKKKRTNRDTSGTRDRAADGSRAAGMGSNRTRPATGGSGTASGTRPRTSQGNRTGTAAHIKQKTTANAKSGVTADTKIRTAYDIKSGATANTKPKAVPDTKPADREGDRDRAKSRTARSPYGKAFKLMGIFIIDVAAVILIAVLVYNVSVYFFGFGNSIFKEESNKDNAYQEIEVIILEGDGTTTIAETLFNNGLIKNTLAFRAQCKLQGVDGSFYPGKYTLNTQMDFDEIIKSLQNIVPDTSNDIRFLITEGQTTLQIAQNLEEQGIISAEEFTSACNNAALDFDFISDIPEREYRLEGYLFPDTYFFSENSTAEEIINKLLSRFNKIFEPYAEKVNERGYTAYEILTIASIIEGEVRFPEERDIVASVIYNRLSKGIKLQMDSTVLYALGEYKDRVLEEDTAVSSPYNTYYVDGLPKGPIGNPGEACIKAALNPADTNYLYYVVEDQATGKHYFTNNYDDFVKAKQRYLRNLN